MGEATNYVTIMAMMYLVMGLFTLGIMAINPDSDLLAYNKMFEADSNQLFQEGTLVNGSYTYAFNYSQTGFSTFGADSTVQGTTTSFPDWIRQSNSWWSTGVNSAKGVTKILVNFIGAPYTLLSRTGIDTDLATLIGVFWGILGTIIFANWLLGRTS